MTLGEFELSRVVDGFSRAVRGSTSLLSAAPVPVAAVGAWCVRLPGMRPHAPKRNVIVGLVYLYAAAILTAIGTV
jgi:hypothetical protein